MERRMLAIGPWAPDDVTSRWSDEVFEPSPELTARADEAIAALKERGSPSWDGHAARLSSFEAVAGGLALHLQPARWSLRLTGDASNSLAVICVTRDARGRWLAGHRAAWVATWPSRWALGAAGAVEVGEHPPETMHRELLEEWSTTAERLRVEALWGSPTGAVMLVGQAWLPDGAEVTPDAEHDDFAWWPADVADWPDVADEPLRTVATLLSRAD